MNNRLRHIRNWPELAKQANWSVEALAKNCRVSVRTLHRFFVAQMGKSTKVWMADQRQIYAIELLQTGSSIKEIASCLGYKQPHNFTRKFKNYWGVSPSAEYSPLASPPVQIDRK